ncbi:hypothetical protein [Nostoc sp. CHAB 5715]|uniref:hypothetical protein n=1 Tax=Nostoc sp. CHAB 5715 TaxID=2780400 RepID=UPI001E4624C5|nr:hypothetical protein [Nostoc sp. CHAB 5715]MCC5619924.1 hypothetical protein [Nostoc sp. CHAB 5715]
MILQDKVALVTGGTSGIGRATATLAVSAKQRAFGAAGAKVVFSGRRDLEGEKTAHLIRETALNAYMSTQICVQRGIYQPSGGGRTGACSACLWVEL